MTMERWIALAIFIALTICLAIEWRFIGGDDPR